MKRQILAVIIAVLRIDPNCTWCGGSGTWDGKPCIKCNPVETGDFV